MTDTPAVVVVAQNLRRIEALHQRLREHAEAYAVTHPGGNDLPGGEAMAQLGPVGSFDRWSRRQYVTMEVEGRKPEPPDSAFGTVPVLQTLMFWSEMWREQHGQLWDTWLPTVSTEASWLRYMLQWAYDHEPHFEDFAEDVDDCRVKLENLLRDGRRLERGAPCLYDECGGERLARQLIKRRDEHGKIVKDAEGEPIWDRSDWFCRKCHRTWDEKRYAQMVTAAAELTKAEHIDGEEWTTVDRAARLVGRPVGTVWSWVNRGHVALACMVRGRRRGFVRMADVEAKHSESEAA